jgi:glycosyltransferase involved in cell wall biosynthesis
MKKEKSDNIILMLVFNYFENDSRVLKEAFTLADNNYKVYIFAMWKKGLAKNENIHKNVFLVRVDYTPFHKKVIGKNNFERLKKIVYPEQKSTKKSTSTTSFSKFSFKVKKLSFLKFFLNVINKFFSYKGFYIDVWKSVVQQNLVPNFVHAHDLNTLPLGVKIAKKYKSKLIYDSHELYVHKNRPFDTPKWFKRFETIIERKNIRKCDRVITVSNSIVGYLEKTYNINRPYLIMNAPFMNKKEELTDKNNLSKLLNIETSKRILIYSGAISFNRGLDKIIESLKFIPNTHLVFLGDGAEGYKSYLLSVAKSNNVLDKFDFYGPVKSFEVTSYVQSAYLGLAPIENACLSYYFCAPNKVFEYIQGGIPVVASNFPDMELVIKSNEIGETFEPNSPKDIAEKINIILNNKDLYNKYKANVGKIINKYKWENEAKKLVALYLEIK